MSTRLHIPADLAERMEKYGTDRQLSRWLRWSSIALLVLILGLGSFMALVSIDSAVIGTGRVGVQSRVKRISHPTGGIIAKIHVQNGDYVRAGQALLSFDDKVSSSDAELAGLTVAQLLATRARLEAELLGSRFIAFPNTLKSGEIVGSRGAVATEERLFGIRQSETAGIIAQLGARIFQFQKQIDGFQAQIEALHKQQELIAVERKGIRDLWEKKLVTIGRLNQIERTAVEMEGAIASLRASIAQTRARITETQEQLIQVQQSRRSDAGAQLAEINGVLNQQQFRSISAEDIQERSVVRAPYSGLIDKLAFAAVGDVVRPAESILEIVPDKDRLLVEGAIQPADIDQVKIGQRARVRFAAFNLSTTPEYLGTVAFVAPELSVDPNTRASFFSVRVQLDPKTLPRGQRLDLKPGMPAEIFLDTGSRSILSYLTKPIQDQLSRAFRDNQ